MAKETKPPAESDDTKPAAKPEKTKPPAEPAPDSDSLRTLLEAVLAAILGPRDNVEEAHQNMMAWHRRILALSRLRQEREDSREEWSAGIAAEMAQATTQVPEPPLPKEETASLSDESVVAPEAIKEWMLNHTAFRPTVSIQEDIERQVGRIPFNTFLAVVVKGKTVADRTKRLRDFFASKAPAGQDAVDFAATKLEELKRGLTGEQWQELAREITFADKAHQIAVNTANAGKPKRRTNVAHTNAAPTKPPEE